MTLCTITSRPGGAFRKFLKKNIGDVTMNQSMNKALKESSISHLRFDIYAVRPF